MNNKILELKDTIYQLYCKEGKSTVYISNLLKLNRKKLGLQLKDWEFEKLKVKRITPSNKKFINKYKNLIISRLKNNISLKDISKEINIPYSKLLYTYKLDNDLISAVEEYREKLSKKHNNIINDKIEKSSRLYNIEPIEGEIWKPILGYDGYEISNKGRVKHFAISYNKFYLLTLSPNQKSNRFYVTLCNNDKKENLQVARLVGFNFCDGYSEINNTINHKDGNVQNNDASNLEWVSQSYNNLHAYNKLKRQKNIGTPNRWTIIYNNKYIFKTIAAYARFIGKSETQARRYIDNPEKYNIKVIDKLI